MRKRLTIFCFFNKKGTVEQYVCDLLEQIETVSERIIIVINGEINADGRRVLQQYSNELIQRENKGLDQGAYRDVLNKYLTLQEIKEYDDVILCNDTFYGFFTPLPEIFNTMEMKRLDMWGLNIIDRVLIKHIQSYFLVFSSDGIDVIYEYFKDVKYVSSYGEAVAFIETNLLKYIENKGLKYSSYVNTDCTDVYTNPFDSVVKYGLPIIKRKCLDNKVCDTHILKRTIDYICSTSAFNYSLPDIKEEIIDIPPKKMAKARITEKELLEWSKQGSFYIFGAGKMGQLIYYTYFKDNDNFSGFVVTDTSEQLLKTFNYKEIADDSRVIIGVGQDLQEEVYDLLPDTMEKIRLWQS